MIKVEMDLELDRVRQNYIGSLSRVRYACSRIKIGGEEVFDLSWQDTAEQNFLERLLMRGVKRIGRRLSGWKAKVTYGYPLSRVELMIAEDYLSMLDDINDALEEYLLKSALFAKLSTLAQAMGEISRQRVELLKIEAEDALNSVVEFMVINEFE